MAKRLRIECPNCGDWFESNEVHMCMVEGKGYFSGSISAKGELIVDPENLEHNIEGDLQGPSNEELENLFARAPQGPEDETFPNGSSYPLTAETFSGNAEDYFQAGSPVLDAGPVGEYSAPASVPMTTTTPRLSLAHEMAKAARWSRTTFMTSGIPHYSRQIVEEAHEVADTPGDASELADVMIVLAGLADMQGIDLAQAIHAKMEINKTRRFDEDGNRIGKTPKQKPRSGPTESVLQEAQRLVMGERRQDYGPVSPSFIRIATIWGAILERSVTPEQVALCMIGLKMVRATQGYKRDSIVDIAGYALCVEQVQEEMA